MKNKFVIIFAILIAQFFFSCKKDKSVLGTEIQPAEDQLSAIFSDNTPVYAHTNLVDSIFSVNSRYKYLGCNQDPHFGKTEMGLCLNANFSFIDLKFGRRSKIISSEIVLALDENLEYCGDLSAALTYSVYTLDSSLIATRNYYTTNDRLYNKIAPLSVSTSTIVNGTKRVIKIPIDNAYTQQLMLDTNNLTSNDVFLNKYKGFYIKASNQANHQGVVYRVDLENDLSGLFFNFKADTLKTDTAQTFRFNFFGTSAVKFNTVKKDLTNANINLKNQIQGDTLAGTKNLFLKGMGFSKIKVYIPQLVNYADSFKIGVNRAELVFNVDVSFPLAGYLPPPRLTLLPLDSLGREIYAQDQLNSTDYARYDGSYDTDKNRYIFNIARHAQAILNKEIKNYGFHLVVANSDLTISTPLLAQIYILTYPSLAVKRDEYNQRVVLCGSDNLEKKPKFNFSYIKLNKQ